MKKRSMYSLRHQTQSIGWMFGLQPFMILHTAPGDTFSGSCMIEVKLAPLAHPVMQEIFVHQYIFYIPYRLVWDLWEEFLAAGPNDDTAAAPVPTRNTAWAAGFQSHGSTAKNWNALPLRAYNLTYNEFFRDAKVTAVASPDVVPPDGAASAPRGGVHQVAPQRAMWNLPRPDLETGTTASAAVAGSAFGSLTVNAKDILRAIAEQKLQMRRATYGTRYVDILRSFGVNVNYQMLQRPELVAAAHGVMPVNDVLATTTATGGSKLGDQGGYGSRSSYLRVNRKSFPEHGILLGVLIVRPSFTDRYFIDVLDSARPYQYYYDPGLEVMPQVEVRPSDVLGATALNASSVIGYIPWGEWYREAMNKIHPELEPWGLEHFGNVAWASTNLTLANLVKGNSSNYNNLFSSSAIGHFQYCAVNNLRAARLISRGTPASTPGST